MSQISWDCLPFSDIVYAQHRVGGGCDTKQVSYEDPQRTGYGVVVSTPSPKFKES